MANTRLPYASTLLQTGQVMDDDDLGEKIVDDILMHEEEPLTVENDNEVPLDMELIHIGNPEDGELIKMETRDVPLNFHLLQLDAPNDDPA